MHYKTYISHSPAMSMHNDTKFTLITLAGPDIVPSIMFVPMSIILAQDSRGSNCSKSNPSCQRWIHVRNEHVRNEHVYGFTPMPGQSITRDSVTLLLEGKTIPGKGFIHLYNTTPYMIHNGHVASHVPCDTSSKLVVNLLAGQVNGTFAPSTILALKGIRQPGQMCLSHVNINSDMAKKIYITDMTIRRIHLIKQSYSTPSVL